MLHVGWYRRILLRLKSASPRHCSSWIHRTSGLKQSRSTSNMPSSTAPSWLSICCGSGSTDTLPTGSVWLFCKILNNSTHTLHTLLPPQSIASQHYHLRRRNHDRQLPTQTSHLCNKNFITRALYKDCYWTCTFNLYVGYSLCSYVYSYVCIYCGMSVYY